MPEHRGARLPRPALMLVTDSARLHDRRLDDVVREAVLGGANIVQLREKHLATPSLIELGSRVKEAIASGALFFVNGDVDAAIKLRADGIHLPEDAPAAAEIRARVGDRMLISRAVHSMEGAAGAERSGVDLLLVGTVFATASKPGVHPLSIAALRAICEATRIPVIAIGGITHGNAADALTAGAAGVAVIGAIFDAASPCAAAAELAVAISGGVGQPAKR